MYTLSRARAVAAVVLGLSSFAALSWAQQLQQQQPQFDLGAAVPQGDSAYRSGSGGLGIGESLMRLPLLGGTLTGGAGGGGPSASIGGGGGGALVGGSLGGGLAGNNPASRTVSSSNAVFGGGGAGVGAGAGATGGTSVAGGGSLTSWAAGVEEAVAQMRQGVVGFALRRLAYAVPVQLATM
jgi:hypothetical protein